MIAWVILRYGVRLPIGLFFGACSMLMALLAVVFTGHGVKALQEAGVIAVSPVGIVDLPGLDFYTTIETMLAQALVLLSVITTFAWTRASNRRGVKPASDMFHIPPRQRAHRAPASHGN